MRDVLLLSCCGLAFTFAGADLNRATAQEYSSIAAYVAATGTGFDRNPADYDILLAAVTAADLVGPLSDSSADLTLFAPNDAAFIRLARSLGFTGVTEAKAWDFLVAALTDLGGGDPIPVLTNVLLYHVSPSSLTPVQVLLASFREEPIPTLLDGATFQPSGLNLIDNDPSATDPTLTLPINVSTGNGIVYTISSVLLPIDVP